MGKRKTYRVERGAAAARDLDSIFDFLLESYLHFGDDLERAFARATARVERMQDELRGLGETPHQGTLRTEMLANLRSVTRDDAVFYFTVDDERRVVRVLAVFFGGQDHQRRMLRRLSRREEP